MRMSIVSYCDHQENSHNLIVDEMFKKQPFKHCYQAILCHKNRKKRGLENGNNAFFLLLGF